MINIRPIIEDNMKKVMYGYYLNNYLERRRNKVLLNNARNSNGKKNDNPLVSVVIPTYNRGKLLTERTIPSILRQTYQNLEVIIVGDHCIDDTEKLMGNIKDKRVKFYNLPVRGQYPENPLDRWKVAGVVPMNKAMDLASGEWITPLDDDDEYSDDHIEILLNHAREKNLEFVYGVVEMEMKPGEWQKLGSYPLRCGQISHLSVMYHASLKFIKYDINAWKYGEPADWNRCRRIEEAGVRVGFVNKVVGKHYLEGTQLKVNNATGK